jgi:protein-tyrosine phosphatase
MHYPNHTCTSKPLRSDVFSLYVQNGTVMSFPIPDRGVPASNRQALSLLGNTAATLEQGQNIALHCRQGIGRSAW